MRVKLNFGNCFQKYSVIYNNQEYPSKNNNYIFLDLDDDHKKIYIKNHSKSSVSFDLLDLFLEMFYGDSTTTLIYCDYSFEILSNENCEITLKENNFVINDRIKYLSYCAVSENAELGNDRFISQNIDKLIKKHKRIHFLFLSGLPLYILIAILALIFDNGLLWIFILIFLLFTLPSIKQRKTLKKHIENKTGIENLQKNVTGFREDDKYEEKLLSKADKIFFKLFEKLFTNGDKK